MYYWVRCKEDILKRVLLQTVKTQIFGVAPIMQVKHVRNKNSIIQGRPLNAIKLTFHTKKLLIKERICSLWEQNLSFKRSFHFEKGGN